MLHYFTIAIVLLLSTSAWGGQKCTDASTLSKNEGRFTSNENGTVIDATTGLIWQRCLAGLQGSDCSAGSPTKLTKAKAKLKLRLANEDKLNGHSDWRLPSLAELTSLLEEGCKSPSIDLDAFPGTPNSFVWTTSPNERHKHFSWYVHFNTGKSGHIWGDRTYTLRMVRTAFKLEEPPTAIDKTQPYWWKKLSSGE